MRQFIYEVDAIDENEAIKTVTEKVDTDEAYVINASSKVVMRMASLPKPGHADSLKRNLSKVYRLASSLHYGKPTRSDAGDTWEMTEDASTGTDATAEAPFCVAIDCGIPSWDVIAYRKVSKTKATARYHLRYVVEADNEAIADFDKVSEAKAFAKQVMVDPASAGMQAYPDSVAIRRMPVSDGGSNVAGMYQKKVRTSKTRPTKTPEGATVVARHHWLVYGQVPADSYRLRLFRQMREEA